MTDLSIKIDIKNQQLIDQNSINTKVYIKL